MREGERRGVNPGRRVLDYPIGTQAVKDEVKQAGIEKLERRERHDRRIWNNRRWGDRTRAVNMDSMTAMAAQAMDKGALRGEAMSGALTGAAGPSTRVVESMTIGQTRFFDVRVWRDETAGRESGPDEMVVSLLKLAYDCVDPVALGLVIEALGRINAYEILARVSPGPLRVGPRGGIVVYPRWP